MRIIPNTAIFHPMPNFKYSPYIEGHFWFQCPDCELTGLIDPDQYNGRISIDCPECAFHATVDLSHSTSKKVIKP